MLLTESNTESSHMSSVAKLQLADAHCAFEVVGAACNNSDVRMRRPTPKHLGSWQEAKPKITLNKLEWVRGVIGRVCLCRCVCMCVFVGGNYAALYVELIDDYATWRRRWRIVLATFDSECVAAKKCTL